MTMERRLFLLLSGGLIGRPLLGGETLPVPRPLEKPVRPSEAVLAAGETTRLRVRQVRPHDGMAPAERLLNSRAPLQPGDTFIADVECLKPAGSPNATAPVGGRVEKIDPPGLFGREGRLHLILSQIVRQEEGRLVPWHLETHAEDAMSRRNRLLLNSLFALEGIGVGTSVAAQFSFSNANPSLLALGGGVGFIIATAMTATRRGLPARLDPGDRFEVTVGGLRCRPLPSSPEILIFPAQEAKK